MTSPMSIWQATVASEDRTFWENNGVDFQGIVRAALANLEAGEIVQGASTITQQVIDYARVLGRGGRDDAGRSGRLARGEPRRHRPRRAGATEGGRDAGRRLPAAGAEQLDRHRGQDPREHPGHAGHGGLSRPRRQGADPRDVPEPHLLRQRLVRHQGGGGELLRPHRPGPAVGRAGGVPRGPAPAPVRSRPVPESELHASTTPRRALRTPSASGTSCSARCSRRATSPRAEEREASNTTWLAMAPSRLTSILREPHFSFRVRKRPSASSPRSPKSPIRPLAVRIGGYRITTSLDLPTPAGGERARHEVGRHARRHQRQQLGARRHRLGDRRDRGLCRQRRLLQPRVPRGPGPVRRGGPRPAAARLGLQADHLRIRLPVARRDGLDDARRRHHRVRDNPGDLATGRRTPTSRSTARCSRSTRCATR